MPLDWARPLTAALFGIAGLTDWLDGYLARKWDQTSRMGAFLDPVADKLIVAAVLVLLVADAGSLWVTIPALVIISREITISALREWMAELGMSSKVAVSMIGKIKTTVQMFAIGFLLHRDDFIGMPTHEIGVILLVIAALLTVISMVVYLRTKVQFLLFLRDFLLDVLRFLHDLRIYTLVFS